MKIPRLLLLLFAVTSAFVRAEESAAVPKPELSLVRAAEIAQATLDKLDAPAGSFIRQITLARASGDRAEFVYKAYYLPSPARTVISPPPSDPAAGPSGKPVGAPPAVTFKYLQITMSGAASVVEEERDLKNGRVLRRTEIER